MPTLILAQTLLLISQIRSFEKSIKFSSYFLQNENYMEIFLYFSISKLQTCNWTVTTEEQISPVVNFDQTKFLQISKMILILGLLKTFEKLIFLSAYYYIG